MISTPAATSRPASPSATVGFRCGLLGTGAWVPPRIVTNRHFVEDLGLETTEEWIERKTGIRERRYAEAGTTLADMASRAARTALARSRTEPSEVTLIVVATSSADFQMPSTAALVQAELGAWNAAAFDLNAACSGFVYALDVAARCQQSLGGRVLVIGADRGSSLVSPRDRGTCIFFGDGAGAAVLGCDGSSRLLASEVHARGDAAPLEVPAGGHMRMDGRAIWDFATRKLPETILSLCERGGIAPSDLSLIVPHQANANILQAAADDLDLPLSRFAVNLDRYGNTIAASIPLALDEALSAGRGRPGDYVALVGFGAGLCWGGQLLVL